MNRKGFVEGECLIMMMLLCIILGFTSLVLNGAKQFAIAGCYPHPGAFALLCVVSFWCIWLGTCYFISKLSYWLKWPRYFYPNTKIGTNHWLVDNKRHLWQVTKCCENGIFELEHRHYPAAFGCTIYSGRCNEDLSGFSTIWNEAGTKLIRYDYLAISTGNVFLATIFGAASIALVVSVIKLIVDFFQWLF